MRYFVHPAFDALYMLDDCGEWYRRAPAASCDCEDWVRGAPNGSTEIARDEALGLGWWPSPEDVVLAKIQHAIDKSADVRHPQAPLFATPDKCPTETPEDRFYADRRMSALGGLPPLQRKQVEDMMRRRREREEQEDKAHNLSVIEGRLATGGCYFDAQFKQIDLDDEKDYARLTASDSA